MTVYGFWTPERINKAARLWADGATYSFIAANLSERGFELSRGAIAGLANRHRNLFPKRKKEVASANMAEGQKRRKRAKPETSKQIEEPPKHNEAKMNVLDFKRPETPVASHGYDKAPVRTIAPTLEAKKPVLVVHNTTIKPRVFERGFSATYNGIQSFLMSRGYDLSSYSNCYFLTRRVDGKHIVKRGKWGQVIDFTDTLRLAEGLEPIRARKSA